MSVPLHQRGWCLNPFSAINTLLTICNWSMVAVSSVYQALNLEHSAADLFYGQISHNIMSTRNHARCTLKSYSQKNAAMFILLFIISNQASSAASNCAPKLYLFCITANSSSSPSIPSTCLLAFSRRRWALRNGNGHGSSSALPPRSA